MHFLLPKISLTLENTQQRQLLKHSGKWKSGEKYRSKCSDRFGTHWKTRTWHLHKDWVSVQVLQGADTMRGLDVQGIYYEKRLWGEMGREPGELPGTGLTTWRAEKKVCIGSILDSQFWRRKAARSPGTKVIPTSSTSQELACLPHQLCHPQSSTRNGLREAWCQRGDGAQSAQVGSSVSYALHSRRSERCFFMATTIGLFSSQDPTQYLFLQRPLEYPLLLCPDPYKPRYCVPLNSHSISPLLSYTTEYFLCCLTFL